MTLAIQRLHPDATLPVRAYGGDAGLDLHACEAMDLGPGVRASVGTGLSIALPAGHAGLVVPRSGLAARHGISVVNAPGLIDEGYRGEVRVLLLNTDPEASFSVAVGDRIAQLVIVATPDVSTIWVGDLPASARGEAGFGSTGTS